MTEWVLVERPGFSGKSKAKRHELWNDIYGKDNWDRIWTYGDQILDFLEICEKYEGAYLEHAKKNPEIWKELLESASDVYDNNISNINSKHDYTHQESNSTHIQDIAVRNVVKAMGLEFKGENLIRVRRHSRKDYRSKKDWGWYLSPGIVEYHEPKMIEEPSLAQQRNDSGEKAWWGIWTVEDMYQSNKWLAVTKQVLESRGEYTPNMRSYTV
ncbi:MAG: hypothetical protein GOU98_02645 [Candidatus Altiarchaeota archaeon]|nr:hypothetical protein [Candidatus Altiarchaeota archaeon]